MNKTIFLLELGIIFLTLAGMWRVYEKAGRKGWEALIPIYNFYVLTRIIKKPGYWTVLIFIPLLGVIWQIWAYNVLAKAFNKSEGFTAGLIFLPFIFFPILGFGNAEFAEVDTEIDDANDDYIQFDEE